MISSARLTLNIVSVVFFTFIGYLTVGLPLAVLPLYVHNHLGYGAIVAGLTISLQYLATFLSRAPAGRLSDSKGPKASVMRGLLACGASGVLLFLAGVFDSNREVSLGLILVSRLFLGVGESYVGTGAIMWGIGRVGHDYTAKVISWNGIATFGALALGAPLGIALQEHLSFLGVGALIAVAAWLSIIPARKKPAVIPEAGIPVPISRVFTRVFWCGMGLALGAIGFASISTFVTLYYQSHGWAHAEFALSAFGLFFITSRLFFADSISRVGGYQVALFCFTVETIGLVMLWLAASPAQALMACIVTALGFALVFPALGVEAVSRVPGNSRGAALGVYSVFTDLALGITGPVGGWIATELSFQSIYLFAGFSAAASFFITAKLWQNSRRTSEPRLAP